MDSILTHPINNILVLRPDRLGDIILTLPVIKNLKDAYPGAQIFYLCTDYTSQILRSYTLISDLIIYDRYDIHKGLLGTIRLAKELKMHKFDLAIHLLPRFPLALATYLSKIRYTVGTGYRWYAFLFTHRKYEHRKHNQYHETEYNLRLLDNIGLPSKFSQDVFKYFSFPVSTEIYIRDFISIEFKNRPLILIHPGSGGSSIDWPFENYIGLIRCLNQWGKYEVGITGVESERNFLAPLLKSDLKIYDFVGLLNLNQLAILLKKSALLVSNSTGPLHLAVAMDTLVLGFYPNSPGLGPQRWGPYQRSEMEYLTPQHNGTLIS